MNEPIVHDIKHSIPWRLRELEDHAKRVDECLDLASKQIASLVESVELIHEVLVKITAQSGVILERPR